MAETIQTPLTKMLGITHPILLAGMASVSTAELAAAVTNAGGLGVMGGLSMSPNALKKQIVELKSLLKDKNAPFGIDLLLPQVGGGARKTNKDYQSKENLIAISDTLIQEKCRIFISAVGVPPGWLVEKLHAAGILIGNMCGSPHHATKAIAAGVDVIIAQGGEGGGHTGEIGTMVLIRQVMDAVRGHKSALTGQQISVVAAGGIADGHALAAALMLGAEAVWVGTRFICATEASGPPRHREAVISCGPHDTYRTLVVTGRPMRVRKSAYLDTWEVDRKDQIQKICDTGITPLQYDMENWEKSGKEMSVAAWMPLLMGQVATQVKEVKSAEAIVNDMMSEAVATIRANSLQIAKL